MLVVVVLFHLVSVMLLVALPAETAKTGLRVIDISFDANTHSFPDQTVKKPQPRPPEAVIPPLAEPPETQQQPALSTNEAQPPSPVQNESSGQSSMDNAADIQPFFKLTRIPSFARKIEAVYPAAEKRAGVEAYILAEVTIDATGQVLSIRILKSGGAAFDDAVRESLSSSIFNPGMIDGRAVGTRFQIPFRFSLN